MVFMVTSGDIGMSAGEAAQRAGVTVRTANASDLPEVLRVQHEGFRRVAVSAGVPEHELPPVAESLADLEALFADGVRTFVGVDTAAAGERIVGTVRATERPNSDVEIGRLAVAGDATRRGVATALMLALEEAFPATRRFVLFTGAEAREPLGLYAKLGYRIFRTQRFETWDMVWLAKERPGATPATDAPLH
jgi:ribosomal protein S18 acetylase RimI-like enzyme